MEKDETQKEVEKLVLGDDAESSPAEEPKKESSPEVKPDPEPAKEPEKEPAKEPEPAPEPAKPIEGKNADQLQTQVNNLNIALKKQRDEGKAESEALKKELTESKALLDRLKGAFAPEPEEEPEPSETKFMTQEQLDDYWEKKENERTQKEEEEKRTASLQTEVATLEKQWDGQEGKPKYDDTAVLQWQKDNEKLYLPPTEAFNMMYRKEILDFEVKQRMAKVKSPQDVEKPSSQAGVHEPGEILPKTEQETRRAVEEAIDIAEAEG